MRLVNDETREAFGIAKDTDMVVFRDGRLDDTDFKVIIEELSAHDIVAEPVSSQGLGPPEWTVVLEWIRDETEQAFYTALVLALGQRLWRHFKQKQASPPGRVNITRKGRTFSAEVSESAGIAGEVRRMVFYSSEGNFLRAIDEFAKCGFGVYRLSRIPSDLIAENGETFPFALIATPEFDDLAESSLRQALTTLRSEIGDFRIYDMDGHRTL
jgi:hypothetical protein